MPSPVIAIPMNQPTYEPTPSPSSACTTIASGRLPAMTLSMSPTPAAINCWSSTGTASTQMADGSERPASLPERMTPSRSG